MAKVKNYNLNVTEVRDPDFQNAFFPKFHRRDPILDQEGHSLRMKDLLKMVITEKRTKICVDHLVVKWWKCGKMTR